jgi:hypothetical protein
LRGAVAGCGIRPYKETGVDIRGDTREHRVAVLTWLGEIILSPWLGEANCLDSPASAGLSSFEGAAAAVAAAAGGDAIVDRRESVVAVEAGVEVDGEITGGAAVDAAMSVELPSRGA